MRILFLSLNSDPLSRKPKTYGGCGKTMRLLAGNLDNCYIAGERSCFEEDLNEKCIPLDKTLVDYVRSGYSLKDYSYGGLDSYDLIVYAEPKIVLNTTKPQLCWAVGANETVNPDIKNLLLHNPKWQQPIIQNPATKVYEFVLGIEIRPFEQRAKENFIFQCSNQYKSINSHLLANWCVKNKIKVIFAGPIDPNYKQTFLNEIDYNWATYIGEIDESEKIKLLKRSKAYAGLWGHPINGPVLGVKQALNYNCWILSTPAGIMPEVIENGKNGFLINNEQDFLNAWNYRDTPDQFDCWETSTRWGLDKMIESFQRIVDEVLS